MQAPIRLTIAISEIRNQSIVSFQRFQPEPAFRIAGLFLGSLGIFAARPARVAS
jgi:hypothetical protein